MYMYKASTGNIICPVVMLNYLKGDEGNDRVYIPKQRSCPIQFTKGYKWQH